MTHFDFSILNTLSVKYSTKKIHISLKTLKVFSLKQYRLQGLLYIR